MRSDGCAHLPRSLQLQKIRDQPFALVGENTFGMELHAFDGEFFVAQAHNHARAVVFSGVRADFEFGGQMIIRHDQRVVAGGGHRGGDAVKDGAAIVLDATRLTVHQFFGSYDFPAEGFAQSLVSEANAQYRNLAGKVANQFDADAGLVRSAGARRDDDAVGTKSFDIGNAQLIVAADFDFGAQLSEILNEVVGKGVVIVEDEDHGRT